MWNKYAPMMESQNYNDKVLLINKPPNWTSFDVIKKLRNTLQVRKIGHAGTLDPLATGLLIVCTGCKTKTITQYQEMNKVYTGQFVIGKTTPSIDLETPFDTATDYSHITPDQVTSLAQTFLGVISQVPPQYSAVKVNGTRAYTKARKGEQVPVEPRKVTIEAFTVTGINLPEVNFEITCSKGTYIRSLVRDIGDNLGVGAYLSQLCRTQIGPYTLKQAWSPPSSLSGAAGDHSLINLL